MSPFILLFILGRFNETKISSSMILASRWFTAELIFARSRLMGLPVLMKQQDECRSHCRRFPLDFSTFLSTTGFSERKRRCWWGPLR